jgi:prophage antirepressor-like protein
MNALIDLKDCKEHMTVTINGHVYQINLSGTLDDPYFCGKDVCTILGYKDREQALRKRVKPKHKKSLSDLKKLPVSETGNFLGIQEDVSYHDGKVIYINEPGLYSLIMSSEAPFAEEFQDMVYEKILPSIRKHGSYSMEQQLSFAMEQLAIKDKSFKEETRELKLRITKELKTHLHKWVSQGQELEIMYDNENILIIG